MTYLQPKNGPRCHECPLYQRGVVVHDIYPSTDKWSKVAFVGEMPGQNEVRQQAPFVGMSGKLLDTYLGQLNQDRHKIFVTNAQRCGLAGGAKLGKKEAPLAVECCLELLYHNLEVLRPEVVVAMGAVPWSAFSGIQKIVPYRGCVLDKEHDDDFYVMATFHPAYILRQPLMTDVVGDDLEKAFKLARGELEYYKPNILPATFENVMTMLDQAHKIGGPLTIDVETDSKDALTANLKTVGLTFKGQGISTPLYPYQAPGIPNFYTPSEQQQIEDKLRAILSDPEMEVVFHNLAYDVPVLERCL